MSEDDRKKISDAVTTPEFVRLIKRIRLEILNSIMDEFARTEPDRDFIEQMQKDKRAIFAYLDTLPIDIRQPEIY